MTAPGTPSPPAELRADRQRKRDRSVLPIARWAAAASAALAIAQLPASAAHAGDTAVDGAYGRLDGDLAMAAEAGLMEGFSEESLSARLSASFLHTMGIYAHYAESFDLARPNVARSVAAGVEIRPLFLPRFTEDLERGPAVLDLWVDSVALTLGLFGAGSGAHACSTSGVGCWTTGVEVGAGMELPLLGQAEGPFIALRGFARWPASSTDDANTPVDGVRGGLTLSLGYRLVVDASLVEAPGTGS